MKTARIALCQINPTVGDLKGNVQKILEGLKQASAQNPDVVVFPELAITGYPPEDLLLKPRFIHDNLIALDAVRKKVGDTVVVVGFVDRKEDIYNAAAVLHNSAVVNIYHKVHLPNYGVFDESRYFQAGTGAPLYQMGDIHFGITICEDMWYAEGPLSTQALEGAEFIVNINASPYHIGKCHTRERLLSTRASDNSVIIAYLNTVGGQDELVFDGHSLVVDQDGAIIAAGKQFEEDLIVLDLNLDAVFMKRLHDPRRRRQAVSLQPASVEKVTIPHKIGTKTSRRHSSATRQLRLTMHTMQRPEASQFFSPYPVAKEVYHALVLGTHDYVMKNGFKKVTIGLSGGIDSSLVAAIAVDAVGRDNVVGIFMPSPYTSQASREDVDRLTDNLRIKVIDVPITTIFESYLLTLKPAFSDMPTNTTEENLQARIRGNILMALSNKFGWLVLTTGNKSEMSVGYATLYGDMAGGFAVIKDVAKTLVYEVARWKNSDEGRMVIPEQILNKEPTAELRPGQKDTDSLPAYAMLDPIIQAYIERDESIDEIIAQGFDKGVVKKVAAMIDWSEYKRRQAPPGIKITVRAFGRDRRFPITNRYRGL